RPQRHENPADVGILQLEAELDSEESEAHVPDIPERDVGSHQSGRRREGHCLPRAAKRIACPPPGASFNVSVSLLVTARVSISIKTGLPSKPASAPSR